MGACESEGRWCRRRGLEGALGRRSGPAEARGSRQLQGSMLRAASQVNPPALRGKDKPGCDPRHAASVHGMDLMPGQIIGQRCNLVRPQGWRSYGHCKGEILADPGLESALHLAVGCRY